MRKPCQNKKEGWGVYPGVFIGWCAAIVTFCWQCVCVARAGEKEGKLKGLCLLFYELGLWVSLRPCTAYTVHGLRVPEPASPVIPTLVRTIRPGSHYNITSKFLLSSRRCHSHTLIKLIKTLQLSLEL